MRNVRVARFMAGFVTVLLALSSFAWAQSMDLAAGLLNGVPVCGMTVDGLADELGHPSAVEREITIGRVTIGPVVHYHPLGLSMRFRGSDAPAQTLQGAHIYMSETWDEDHSEHYRPTPLSFASGATLNWRTDESLAAFASFGPRDFTPELGLAAYEEGGLATTLGARELRDFMHIVDFRVDERMVRFHHEPTKRYLEFVTIGCNVGD